LTNAATQLDSSHSYVFGTAGGNGYLAYDGDGSGITGVIELVGLTNSTFLSFLINPVI
jgi:hypothetical protein